MNTDLIHIGLQIKCEHYWLCISGSILVTAKHDYLPFQTKAGYYDECMETPLLNQLMDADLYLLFRFSLDDNTETMVTAALLALRNLLWNHPDEVQHTGIKAVKRKGHSSRKCRIVNLIFSKTFIKVLEVNSGLNFKIFLDCFCLHHCWINIHNFYTISCFSYVIMLTDAAMELCLYSNGHGLYDWRIVVSFLAQQGICLSLIFPDWYWGLPSLLYFGCGRNWGLFFGGGE